jgi:3-oxoacyl-[acyl-carrier-protein] synthase II
LLPRAITGLGIVSALGIGRDAFFAALKEGGEGTSRAFRSTISAFDATAYPDIQVAEVPDFDPTKYLGDKGLRTLDRLTKLMLVSARLALHDGGIKKDGLFVHATPDTAGVVCSNAYGSLEAIAELDRVAVLEDARYINPAKFPNTVSNSASGYVSIWEDLQALNVAVSDGNCGALDAVACADIYLETGRADVLLVGGAEALSEGLFLAFHRLGALGAGTPTSQPPRSGTLGEGAAFFVMEPAEDAAARGAKVYAEVIGYGTAFLPPAGEALLFHASAAALDRAIASALTDAGIGPKDIDIVASGVSGMRAFDDAELLSIGRSIRADVPVAAPKSLLGDTLGASGAMGMAAAVGWMQGVTPSPLLPGRAEVKGPIRTVLVTSMGFYGNASAVAMRVGGFDGDDGAHE